LRLASKTVPIASSGNVPIFFEQTGEGEPVVLVHGTTGSHLGWAFVVPQLAERFQVTTYDRRGRGQSGDAPDYSLQTDADDLQAVIRELRTPVHVVGHSHGARVVLQLAATGSASSEIASMTLYEPPLPVNAVPPGTWEAVDDATRRQDWERVLELFYPVAALTPQEIEGMRSIPEVWSANLDGAQTVAREVVALRAPVDLDGLRTSGIPSLVLVGGDTDSPVFLDGLSEIIAALSAKTASIEGQKHMAAFMAPDALAAAVMEFIDSP
jgi:pimeloyl-ACP methyl ester carboxylesterase